MKSSILVFTPAPYPFEINYPVDLIKFWFKIPTSCLSSIHESFDLIHFPMAYFYIFMLAEA
jgi:hypothetical protein